MTESNHGIRKQNSLWLIALAAVLLVAIGIAASCSSKGTSAAGPTDLMSIATARGLSPDDAKRAIKTFTAPGARDEYLLFSSGGHSGQIHVFGVPSMRLLKTIGVFTPEPWQGYGYGADWSKDVLAAGSKTRETLRWGDSHHPALSETDGKYDGRWIYINDRAHGRIAMVDLSDFRTKQILSVPNIQTSHGGIFATPDTKYVHISSKTPALKGWSQEKGAKVTVEDHLNKYGEIYRGYSTFLRINPQSGRMELDKSFQIELPPYNQDLADSGKGPSYGWAFINSYNTEMATGGTDFGRPALEAGASKGDFDYLHIINWQKAEQVIAAGKFNVINGAKVIPLQTAIAEGLVYLAPEPRSPHGVDVAPSGNYLTVSGKLDPHATVYGFDKILAAIKNQQFEGRDKFGIPILKFDAVVAGQVELGAGPLHTQYDNQGHAYTSLFLESAVAKWTLPGPNVPADKAFKLVDKISIHYNIGHLATTQGDTMDPQGKYLIALNKWSIDRHQNVGPLHPQNFQLIDISGQKMELLADLPIGVGEPHYAQLIKADVIKGKGFYPLGFSPADDKKSPNAIVKPTDARVVRTPGKVEVWMSVIRSQYKPDIIRAKVGDRVVIHLNNLEQTPDATHGFAVPQKNVMLSLDPGESTTVEFTVTEPGSYGYYCTEFCSALHLEMQGWLIVEG